MCLQWGNLVPVNNFHIYFTYFQISSYQNIVINLDLIPKNDNGYFVAYSDEVYDRNLV